MIALLLWLLFAPTPPPNLIARWDTSTSATVTWHQTARSCLYRESAIGERVFVSCYEEAGDYRVTFGHQGPLSGDLRPAAGDVYVLESGGQRERAPLRGRAVYLAVWRG